MGEKKSHKIHIGKKKNENLCPQLKVHDKNMEDSQEEKYVGDIITGDGKNKKKYTIKKE